MKARELPSQEYLQECFTYDPETGLLYWKHRPLNHFKNLRNCNAWNTRYSNTLALNYLTKEGYRSGKLDRRTMKAHRVIYKLITGDDPDVIDHTEGRKSDNRLADIVNGTTLDNTKNRRKPNNNTSGVVGVYWHKKAEKWYVSINHNKKQKHLGYFDDFEKAVAVRKAAEVEYGYHENHGKERVGT